MRKLTFSFLVVATSVLVTQITFAEEPNLEALAWLSGCWVPESGETGSGENWMSPAGGTMLGMSRTVKDGKTIEYEFLQIRVNNEGKVVYIALPSGQQETTFTAVNMDDESVTFENLQHDFPNRIIYRKLSATTMLARIEGTRNGFEKGIDFPMKRVVCEEEGNE